MIEQTYYQILQVDPNASSEVIDAAYRRLAKTYHPDVNKSPDAERKMKQINIAYQVLRDPVARWQYNGTLKWNNPSPSTSTTAPKPQPPGTIHHQTLRKMAWLKYQHRVKDGYLISIGKSSDFEVTIELLKANVPVRSRNYDPAKKEWFISEDYEEVLEELFYDFSPQAYQAYTKPTPMATYGSPAQATPSYSRPLVSDRAYRSKGQQSNWGGWLVFALVVGAVIWWAANGSNPPPNPPPTPTSTRSTGGLATIPAASATDTAQPTQTPQVEPTQSASLPEASTPTPTETGNEPGVAGTPAPVVYVVDGDTIDVLIDGIKYRVRYILMDTPERGMPYFDEATAANRALVGGKTVYLFKDVSETDRYGRLLRYVYLADGTFVNEELVRQGYAQIATYPPDVAMEELILDAQADAGYHGRGLWGLSDQDDPVEPVEEPEANTDDLAELNRLAAEQPHLLDIYANTRANIRTGPGTNYPIDRVVDAGTGLLVIGQNAAGDWLQIDPGFWWISRDMVDGAAGITWPIATADEDIAPVGGAADNQNNDQCDPAYPDVCIPPVSVAGDLDCKDILQYARFRVRPPDPHNFDGNDDGIGCENN